jgi:hypothetical protein
MRNHEDSQQEEDVLAAVRVDELLRSVEALGGAEEHRRERLVDEAEDRGVERPLAEQAYDIAREEHLDPAYGLALVLNGLSVRPLTSASPDVDASDATEPEWVDAPPKPALAERERRLRQTFRRLRSRLEESEDSRSAMLQFAREPDLEDHAY